MWVALLIGYLGLLVCGIFINYLVHQVNSLQDQIIELEDDVLCRISIPMKDTKTIQ